jgi:hypothetical protein
MPTIAFSLHSVRRTKCSAVYGNFRAARCTTVRCLAPLTFASYAYDEFHLLMPLYICRKWNGFVQAREAQALKWVRPRDLRNYPMPPADAPLIPPLIDLLG